MKKKLKDTKFGKFVRTAVAPLLRETLQTLPVVGTLVTNFKNNTERNPAGQIKLTKWDGYRLVIGLGIGYLLIKGIATMDQITFIIQAMGF